MIWWLPWLDVNGCLSKVRPFGKSLALLCSVWLYAQREMLGSLRKIGEQKRFYGIYFTCILYTIIFKGIYPLNVIQPSICNLKGVDQRNSVQFGNCVSLNVVYGLPRTMEVFILTLINILAKHLSSFYNSQRAKCLVLSNDGP